MRKSGLTSFLTLILCLSLIVGATYALLTSKSNNDIEITTGSVDVKASFSIADVYSPTAINMDCVITDPTDAADDKGVFANGGTVSIDGANVTITNMTPGDKVIFKIDIVNSSSVEFLYRTALAFANDNKDFFDELLIGMSDTADGEYTYYSEYATEWVKGEVVTEAATTTKYLAVEMPAIVDNDMKNTKCSFTLNIDAVQGNVAVSGDEVAKKVYVVGADELANAIANAADGEVVFLNEPAEKLDIAYDEEKDVTLRGYKINELNVNVPNGALHVYNDIQTLTGTKVAEHSLYVYGNIVNIIINEGRLVIENTAKVENVELAPIIADVMVKLEAIGAPIVEKIIVNAAAAAKVIVATPADAIDVLPEVEYTEDSAVKEVVNEAVTEDGTAMTVVTNKDELTTAIANAVEGEIILVNAESIEFPTFDDTGLTFVSTKNTKITKREAVGSGSTFDGFEFTCTAPCQAKDLTFKNCLFSGSNGLYYGACSGEWLIENCVFNNKVYGLQIGEGSGIVNVVGCTFVGGFNTFGSGFELNFTDCTFTADNAKGPYTVFQTHGKMTVTDCVIEASWPTGAQGGTFGSVATTAVTEIYNTVYEGEGSVLDLSENKAVGVMVLNPTKDNNGLYTGGTFAAVPAAELIAEGYTAVENADGTYTVEK